MWTDENAARAAAEGWQLITVIENGTSHALYEVEPRHAQGHIVDRAKGMSTFHINTLKLIAASRIKRP